MDRNFINVIILGIAFMLLFTSFQTGGFIQQSVVKSIHDNHPDYHADGFLSMCIIYATLGVFNWLAPFFVGYMGPKMAMFLSGITYVLFIANFLLTIDWLLYVVSVVVGIGAAFIWTAQGNYLTLCSGKDNMSRNSGIFWALLQCSLLWGNIFVFFYFTGDSIDDKTRIVTYSFLAVVGACGVGCFLLLSKPTLSEDTEESSSEENFSDGILNSFRESFRLLATKTMFLLCLTFCYTGLELAFFSSVYGTAVGNTKSLDSEGKSKKYLGLSGMLVGFGEITGGLVFGILSSKTNRFGRDPIIILGFFVHLASFFLIFINFPKNSTSETTSDMGYIQASLAVALLCSFMLGFGDACYNTQIYSIVGTLYQDKQNAPAFALFKFVQSIACACALFYATAANLYIQLGILAIFAVIGTISFVWVEWQSKRENTSISRIHQN